jgi:hypothetical protein
VGLFPLIRFLLSSRAAVFGENLLLRKRLTLFQERMEKPRGSTAATRVLMVLLSRFLNGHKALVIVKQQTCCDYNNRRR